MSKSRVGTRCVAVAAAIIAVVLPTTIASAASFMQQQKLTASDAASPDEFGFSASLSGDGSTALIGAFNKNSGTGAAYVFGRSGSTWSQQQKLTASDGASNDNFGWSVSLSGDGSTALIGAFQKNSRTGAAYVFSRSGSTWSQQQKLTASDAANGDAFGSSVSLSGDGNTALVGAFSKNSSTGAAYVFTSGPSNNVPESPWIPAMVVAGAVALAFWILLTRLPRGGATTS